MWKGEGDEFNMFRRYEGQGSVVAFTIFPSREVVGKHAMWLAVVMKNVRMIQKNSGLSYESKAKVLKFLATCKIER
jgi:hypothetical protein